MLSRKTCLPVYKIIKYQRLSLILRLQALHVEARNIASEIYFKVIAKSILEVDQNLCYYLHKMNLFKLEKLFKNNN